MKKILMCNISYLPEVGGVENSIRHLKYEYESLDYKVYILAGSKDNNFHGNNNNIIKFRRNRFDSAIFCKLNFIYMFIDLIVKLMELRRNKFDFCISRNQFVTVVAKMLLPCPVIYIVPGFAYFQQSKVNYTSNFSSKIKRIIHHCFDKLALYIADKVCLFSNNMINQALRVYPGVVNKISLTNPGVDISRFLPRYKDSTERDLFIDKYNFSDDSIIILCLGRLVKAKGFDVVIDSLQYLPEKYKCLIVGDGPEKNFLIEMSKELGVSKRVIFLGKSNTPEKIYPICDIFAMSSRYEPFGQTILEAMSCDLPIIAFEGDDITTATYEICGDNAVYCKLDSRELAGKIPTCLNYKEGTNREFVSNHYSWYQLATHVVSLI
ncbi:TPA: glycosyltransferase family 4 protein [Vibrio cholerae]